ncbi:MAG: PASTA domain-containing protein [Bacteroidia bacterium]
MQFLKIFLVHIILLILFVYLVTLGAAYWLEGYTRHGQALTLPDLKGLPIDDAIQTLNQKKLRYQIADTVFVDYLPKLAVVEQSPSPNSNVKEGRIIYLSVNSNTGATVAMPNLINSSLRYAETVLAGNGLKLGNVTYKPDIAQNAVLDQIYAGRSIQPGTLVAKGSSIDLIVGDGSAGASVNLPDLRGLSYTDAINILNQSFLAVGAIVFEDANKDTLRAVVKRQNPPYSEGMIVNSGTQVDLFLSSK